MLFFDNYVNNDDNTVTLLSKFEFPDIFISIVTVFKVEKFVNPFIILYILIYLLY